MLREVLKGEPKVDVVKLQRSGGVVTRNAKYRQKARSYRIRVKYLSAFGYLLHLLNICLPFPFVCSFERISI